MTVLGPIHQVNQLHHVDLSQSLVPVPSETSFSHRRLATLVEPAIASFEPTARLIIVRYIAVSVFIDSSQSHSDS